VTVRLVSLSAVFALLLAGCGGSSKKTAPPPAATSTSSVSTTTSSSSATPSFASTKNCRQLYSLGAKFAQALQSASGHTQVNFSTYARAFQAMADAAPSQIHGDFETLAHAFNGYAQALVKAGFKPGTVPTAAQMAQLGTALKSFDTAKLRAAEQHLQAWARANCTK
jgi:hypothetical protein